MRLLFVLLLTGCASGGVALDGSGSSMDADREDAGMSDAGRVRPRDAGRLRLPDTGPPVDSAFVTSCTGAADDAPCDADRNGCTQGDFCRAGLCIPGAAPDCDDGMNCTNDRCVATGFTSFMCANDVASAVCTIDGVCYANGQPNPANSCQRCMSSASMSSWTITAGVTCDDGDACTRTDVCMADGTCSGSGSGDMFEANDTRGAAHELGDISDGADFPAGTFAGSLYPSGDEDWYVYHDSDDSFSDIYPRVDLENIPAGQDYDLCVYFDCDTDPISVGCDAGSASTFEGLRGCCSAAASNANESVTLDPDCSSTDDSGHVYVRVFRFSGSPDCATYTLEWGDD